MGIDHRPRKGRHGRHALDGLPWAHTVFGNLKTWLRGTFHGVSPKHLQRYLNEFVFRFNQRWQEADLFSPRSALRDRRRPLSLRPFDSRANRIGRDLPILAEGELET
jgi:hypothetical protein